MVSELLLLEVLFQLLWCSCWHVTESKMWASVRKIMLQLVALPLSNNAESHTVKDYFQSLLSAVGSPPFLFIVATAMLTQKLFGSLHLNRILELKLFMIVNTNQIPPMYISHCSAEFPCFPCADPNLRRRQRKHFSYASWLLIELGKLLRRRAVNIQQVWRNCCFVIMYKLLLSRQFSGI